MPPQRSETRDRGQHADRLAGAEPSHLAIIGELGRQGSLGWLGDQHTEGQAGQRPRRYDEQMLVLDDALDRAEQLLVERMSAGEVEG
jgi:hypothetical protein